MAIPRSATKPTVKTCTVASESELPLFCRARSFGSLSFVEEDSANILRVSKDTFADLYSLVSGTGNHRTAHGEPWLFSKVA